MSDLAALEAAIGHTFSDRELLLHSLTHRSYVNEKTVDGEERNGDNEQLEFLGDSVLGFIVSVELVRRHPASREGHLSKLKAHIVSSDHLHVVAQGLGFGEFLLLGRGEEMSGGREKRALLANLVEALIAALFIDGGIEAARQFVVRHIIGQVDSEQETAGLQFSDPKSALQEMAQTLRLPPPRYSIVKQDGPEHAKSFTVEVSLGRDWTGRAQGPSKKSAGQKAAQIVLDRLIEVQAAETRREKPEDGDQEPESDAGRPQ